MTIPDVSPELPPLHWRAVLRFMRYLPQGALSRGFGHIADVPLTRSMRRPVLGAFAKLMKIDVSEAELRFEEYGSINEFFVRRLRHGARVVHAEAGHVVSPVDGVVGQLGDVERGRLLQAKGRLYETRDLLADAPAASRYENGSFATIYLSPRHYHRIHAPVGGAIARADHIPGALFPVNEPSVLHIDRLFPRNERLVCYIDSTHGQVAAVAVGAYNVGRISAAFDTQWRDGRSITNRAGAAQERRTYEPPLHVARGAEIMAFHLGSTIVMLFEHRVRFHRDIAPGVEVTMGRSLGEFA